MLDLSDEAVPVWVAPSEAASDRPFPELDADAIGSSESIGLAFSRLADVLGHGARQAGSPLAGRLRDETTLSELRAVLEQVGVQPTLRLIAWMIDELPGGVPIVVNLIDHNRHGSLGEALAESERSALLQRLYAPERLQALEEACRNTLAASEAT